MRYVSTFRNQLPKDTLLLAFPNLIRFLSSEIPVVHTYACHAIERILTVKQPSSPKDNLITSQDLAPLINPLIGNTMALLDPAKANSNEYAVKCLMRVCLVLQDLLEPYIDEMLAKLAQVLTVTSKNPTKPNFNHYLFEIFGVLIRAVCVKNTGLIQKFEASLFPIFNYVLEQDITEFIPYAFQLLSLMLELQDKSVPQVYHELFPFLLMPVLWERPGYIPALTRLLQAYIEKATETIVVPKIVNFELI